MPRQVFTLTMEFTHNDRFMQTISDDRLVAVFDTFLNIWWVRKGLDQINRRAAGVLDRIISDKMDADPNAVLVMASEDELKEVLSDEG